MRLVVGVLVAVLDPAGLSPSVACAGEPAARHGVVPDLKSFPQATPREALASALRAIERKRIDYLLAQLADPEWVDGRVALYDGGFAELVREAAGKLDPPAVRELQRFLKEGELETLDATALVRHKEIKDRVVRLRKVGDRWFLQNQNKP